MTPSFCRKNGFAPSHLVPEILGPNVGLIFHQNVLLLLFKFLWILYQHSHFYKTLDLIGSNFVSHAEPGYQIFREVPPSSQNQSLREYKTY